MQEICIKLVCAISQKCAGGLHESSVSSTSEICRKSGLSFRNSVLEITPYHLQEIVHEMLNILLGGNGHDSPPFLLENYMNYAVGNVTFGPVRGHLSSIIIINAHNRIDRTALISVYKLYTRGLQALSCTGTLITRTKIASPIQKIVNNGWK